MLVYVLRISLNQYGNGIILVILHTQILNVIPTERTFMLRQVQEIISPAFT